MRQSTYSRSFGRIGRAKVSSFLLASAGVMTLPNLNFQHPLANAMPFAKATPHSLEVSNLGDESLQAIEDLDETSFAAEKQGFVKLAKFAAKQLRERTKTVQKNRLISRVVNFQANLKHNPEAVASLDDYLENAELDKDIKGRAETERFWYGIQAVKTMLGWGETEFAQVQRDAMQELSDYIASDINVVGTDHQQTSVGVDVQVDAEQMLQGAYTEQEKEWVERTAQLIENSIQISQPEHFPMELPDSQFAGEGEIISEEDVFQRPVFETEREIAYNEAGERIYLKDRPELLDDIKQEARIVIPSIKHEGKFHEFKVRFLVNGTKKIKAVFEQGVTTASNQITLQIPRRLFSKNLSYRNVIVNMGHAIYESLDLLVGMRNMVPALSAEDIEREVSAAKAKKIATFLTPVGGTEEDPSYIFETKDENPVRIDLRLQKPGLSAKTSLAVGAALSALEDSLRERRVSFIRETENYFRTTHPEWSPDHILAATEKAWDLLLREKALEAISNSTELQDLDMVGVVVDQFKSTFVFNDLNAELQIAKDDITTQVKEEIREKFKRKSKNPKFFNARYQVVSATLQSKVTS